jgi:cbb3-type cytochrome oxidase cytochrome c subunit
MKIVYQTSNARLRVEAEAQTLKQALEEISGVEDVVPEPCAACGSDAVRFLVREAKGYKYYSLRCNTCEATLDFGQNQDGISLFKRRKNKDGHPKGKDGWYHWRRDPDKSEEFI